MEQSETRANPLLRAVAREAALFSAFFGAAVILTWPMARSLGTMAADLGDPLLNAWILDWVSYALTHSPFELYNAPIFYPARLPLAFSENLVGIALVMLPFYLAGIKPLALHNLAMLIGFAHSGWGASVLARCFTRSLPAAVAAGLFFAFCPFKFDHLSHLQAIWSGWIPLMLAALLVYWKKPTRGQAALLCGAFVMNGLTNIHWLLFGSFTLAATILVLALIRPVRDGRFWIRLAAALLAGSLLLLPFLIPYRIVADEYKMRRSEAEVRFYSATWDGWLRATPRNQIYFPFQERNKGEGERQLFPGLMVLFLSASGFLLARRNRELDAAVPAPGDPPRRLLRTLDVLIVLLGGAAWIGAVTGKYLLEAGDVRILSFDSSDIPMVLALVLILTRLSIRFPLAMGGDEGRSLAVVARSSRFSPEAIAAAVWIVIGVLGSLGLNSFFHTFLFRRVGPFQSLRVPARWAIIAYVGLAVWAALGVSAILERRRGWKRGAMAALLLGLFFVEVGPRVRWEQSLADVPPFYRWLNAERVGPMLELPIENDQSVQYQYLLYAAAHHVPTMNGTSGFEPPLYSRLKEIFQQNRIGEDAIRLLERVGCRIVVVHPDRLSIRTGPVLEWVQAGLAAGRLQFLRRFDSGPSGDYVFAVTKNVPDWPRYFDIVGDRAGFTPRQNLERLFEGKTTFSERTFGRLDFPRPYDDLTGPLRVSGWALSPDGVRSVRVLLHAGAMRFEARLVERPDVSALFPWYSAVASPGYVYEFKKRPKGIPQQTDIQVEIVDGRGRVTRLPDVVIRWD